MKSVRNHKFMGLLTVGILVFLYLPIVNVVANAFNANEHLLSWGGFTLQWFEETLTSKEFLNSFSQGLAIAAVVMVVSIIVALSAVIGFREWGDKAQIFQSSSMYLRLTLPEIVLVVGTLAIARLLGVNLGAPWVVFGQALIYSAYAMVIIQARLSTIADLYENAAYDLGATTWRCMKTVVLPLLAPSILVAALMVFTFSLDSVVSVVFLGGPRTETVPILIMNMLKKGITPEVNAIGVVVTLFNLVVLAIIVKFAGFRSVVSAMGGSSEKAA